jgi:hypothetical protein
MAVLQHEPAAVAPATAVMPVHVDPALAWRVPILARVLGPGFHVAVSRPGQAGIAIVPSRSPEEVAELRRRCPAIGLVVIADWAFRRDALAIAGLFEAGADAYFDGHSLPELLALVRALARRVPAAI